MPMPSDSALKKKIKQLFDEAETELKLVEKLEQSLSIPAVNELRYAGRHLINYQLSSF